MTITTAQLDEIERKARRVQDAIAMNRPLRCVFDEYVEANSPNVTLQLVAVYRAALLVDTAIPDTLHEVQAHRMLRKAIRGEP